MGGREGRGGGRGSGHLNRGRAGGREPYECRWSASPAPPLRSPPPPPRLPPAWHARLQLPPAVTLGQQHSEGGAVEDGGERGESKERESEGIGGGSTGQRGRGAESRRERKREGRSGGRRGGEGEGQGEGKGWGRGSTLEIWLLLSLTASPTYLACQPPPPPHLTPFPSNTDPSKLNPALGC